MSKNCTVTIQICSNCKQHQWCTRHNEAVYTSLATEISKLISQRDQSTDVEILQVGGTKMGSFQIYCNHTLLFSKLALGYFPHISAVTTRVLQYIDDYRNGRSLEKYTESMGSPVRPHTGPGFGGKRSGSQSPQRRLKYKPDYSGISQNKEEEKKDSLKNDEKQEKKQDQQKNQGFILTEAEGDQSIPHAKVSVKEAEIQKKEEKKADEVKKDQKKEHQEQKESKKEEDKVEVKQEKQQKAEQEAKQEVNEKSKQQGDSKQKAQDSLHIQANQSKIQQKNQEKDPQNEGEKKEQKEEKQQEQNYGDDFEGQSKVRNQSANLLEQSKNNESNIKEGQKQDNEPKNEPEQEKNKEIPVVAET